MNQTLTGLLKVYLHKVKWQDRIGYSRNTQASYYIDIPTKAIVKDPGEIELNENENLEGRQLIEVYFTPINQIMEMEWEDGNMEGIFEDENIKSDILAYLISEECNLKSFTILDQILVFTINTQTSISWYGDYEYESEVNYEGILFRNIQLQKI